MTCIYIMCTPISLKNSYRTLFGLSIKPYILLATFTQLAMSRATTLVVILSLLLFSSTLSFSARPEPVTTAVTKTPIEGVEVEEGCEGIGEQECLMRRTLVAHLDYIYTQKKNP